MLIKKPHFRLKTAILHNKMAMPHNETGVLDSGASLLHNETSLPLNDAAMSHNKTAMPHNDVSMLHNETASSHSKKILLRYARVAFRYAKMMNSDRNVVCQVACHAGWMARFVRKPWNNSAAES